MLSVQCFLVKHRHAHQNACCLSCHSQDDHRFPNCCSVQLRPMCFLRCSGTHRHCHRNSCLLTTLQNLLESLWVSPNSADSTTELPHLMDHVTSQSTAMPPSNCMDRIKPPQTDESEYWVHSQRQRRCHPRAPRSVHITHVTTHKCAKPKTESMEITIQIIQQTNRGRIECHPGSDAGK